MDTCAWNCLIYIFVFTLDNATSTGLAVTHYLNNIGNIGIFIKNIYAHKVLKLYIQYIIQYI